MYFSKGMDGWNKNLKISKFKRRCCLPSLDVNTHPTLFPITAKENIAEEHLNAEAYYESP